jgi:hypothetical protein
MGKPIYNYGHSAWVICHSCNEYATQKLQIEIEIGDKNRIMIQDGFYCYDCLCRRFIKLAALMKRLARKQESIAKVSNSLAVQTSVSQQKVSG